MSDERKTRAELLTELAELRRELTAPGHSSAAVTMKALIESERRFHELFEKVPDAIFVADAATGRILETNAAACALLGRTRDEIVGMHQAELHPPRLAEAVRAIFTEPTARSLAGEPTPPVETAIVRQDGTEVPVEIVAHAISFGGPSRILGSFRDISRRLGAERQLARVLEAIDEGVWDHDLRAGTVRFSPRLERLHGFPPGAMPGREPGALLDTIHPEDRPGMEAAVAAHLAGRTGFFQHDFRCRRPSGEWIWIRSRGSVVERDPDGIPVRAIGTHVDVTLEKRAEAALRESEERLRLISDNLPAGMVYQIRVPPGGGRQFAYVSAGVEALHGLTPAAVLADPTLLYAQVIETDQARVVELEAAALRDLAVFQAELRFRLPDGTVRWGLMRSGPRPQPDGSVLWDGVEIDITSRKRAEEVLRETEEFNREFIVGAGEGIVVYDRELRYVIWNRFMEELTGIPAARVLGTFALGQFPRLREQGIGRLLERALAGETCEAKEFDFAVPATGRRGWASAIYHPHRNSRGEIVGVVGMVRDITARKRVEAELRESDERYRSLIATTETGFVIVSAEDGTVLDANQVYAELSGHRGVDEIRGRTVIEWTAPYDRERNAAEVKKCFATGRVRNLVIDYRHADGKIVPIEINADVLTTGRGRIIQTLCRDITERRQAEAALRASEAIYRSLFENMLNGFAYCRMLFDGDHPRDFVYLAVNHAFATLTGLRDVVGKKVTEVIPGIRESDPGLFEIYGRVARTGRPEKFESYVAALEMWFSISVYSPERDHFVAVFDVITERKRAEAALRASEAGLERAQAQAQLGSWEHDFAAKRSYWSKEMFRLLGRDPAGGVPTFPEYLELLQPEDRPRVETANRRAMAISEAVSTEVHVAPAGGAVRSFIDTVECERDERGAPRRMFGTLLEITARKQAEQKLAGSLREKEILLREIHHRVKNNMQVISSLLRLQSRTRKDPEIQTVFRESQDRINAMALVHEKLYQSEDLATVDLRAYLTALVSGLKRSYTSTAARVAVELKVDPVPLPIDRAIPCGLIINELLVNAFKHAFPGERRGTVTIELTAADADRFQLTVRDDGIGVPAGLVVRESPSLGLQLVTTLVEEQLGGTLTVTRDGGAAFDIRFRKH